MINKLAKVFNSKKTDYLISNNIGSKKVISISDLMLFYSNSINTLRLDIVIYYLAIEQYFNKNNIGYKLINKYWNCNRIIKDKSKPIAKKIEEVVNNNEKIIINNNFQLICGIETVALNLFLKKENVDALLINTNDNINYGIDALFLDGFNNQEIKTIIHKYYELMKVINSNYFACIIWAPAMRFINEIVNDISCFCSVIDYKKYNFSNKVYKDVVTRIYDVDDIAKWKIEKKNEHMQRYNNDLYFVKLDYKPYYRIKNKTKLPISQTGELIKKSIRKKYSGMMNDYFYDIVIHIADNIYQSKYIENVIENYDKSF